MIFTIYDEAWDKIRGSMASNSATTRAMKDYLKQDLKHEPSEVSFIVSYVTYATMAK